MHTIYLITNLINGHRYIGYTSKPIEQRWFGHVKDSKRPDAKHDYMPIIRAIRKHGPDNFQIDVLYQSLDGNHTLSEAEPLLIREWRPEYNVHPGGNCPYSEEGQEKARRTRSTPEWKAKAAITYSLENQGSKNHNAKNYKIISPSGEIYRVHSLKCFCRQHGLNYNSCSVRRKGKLSYKGWYFETTP